MSTAWLQKGKLDHEECNNRVLHSGSLDPAALLRAKHHQPNQLTANQKASGPTWKICLACYVGKCPTLPSGSLHALCSFKFWRHLFESGSLKLDMERKVLLYDWSLPTLPSLSSCVLGRCSNSREPVERWCHYKLRIWHRWGPSVSLQFPVRRQHNSKQNTCVTCEQAHKKITMYFSNMNFSGYPPETELEWILR